MDILRKILSIFPVAIVLQGCFTGVESTPKITYSDVKKENISITPEQTFLSDIIPESPANWKYGKEFYLVDNKASLVFSSAANIDSLVGEVLTFNRFAPVSTLTGKELTEIEFLTDDGVSVYYRDNLPFSDISTRIYLDVPFTIEKTLVDGARDKMVGDVYYVTTSLWYDQNGSEAVNGLRHVPVKIVDVRPGNSVYPILVVFAPETDPERYYSMYMTVGNQRTSTRNFDTLFAFDNPRNKYPRISDQDWELIIHSKVREGMSREECRLALGVPNMIGQRPTTAGMVEYWSYSDGRYLLFDEGFLSYYR